MEDALCSIFPDVTVAYNFRAPHLRFPDSQSAFELDIAIPELALAFEYQGQQHFHDTGLLGHFKRRQECDLFKVKICHDEGITLIAVPYWWDKKVSSLKATIQQVRPDLITGSVCCEPIRSKKLIK